MRETDLRRAGTHGELTSTECANSVDLGSMPNTRTQWLRKRDAADWEEKGVVP